MRNILIFVFFFISSLTLQAQTIQATLQDVHSQPIIGATAILSSGKGTITNNSGYFSLTNLTSLDTIIIFQSIGFEKYTLRINPKKNTSLGVINLSEKSELLNTIVISGMKLDATSPISHTFITKKQIEFQNLGQDIPSIISSTPSLSFSSDAGNNIGYTAIRIRGSDQTRINVTLNGVPYNDSESQQVFWVDLPDFASSLSNIQIQRGLGSSTNGSGAFGASIQMHTLQKENLPYADLDNSWGSFGTRKHTLQFGTGLINKHYVIDGRLSAIHSEGYIDRASSNLKSYFLSGAYYGNNTIVQAIASSGHEITYQSWYGTPESRAKNDIVGMNAYCQRNFLSEAECNSLLNSDRKFNYYTYEDQVDNYTQDHYQLHLSHQFSNNLYLQSTLFYTKGNGYYEQFKLDDDFKNYGLQNPVINDLEIESSDIIRRRWLNNNFYGLVLNLHKKWDMTTFDAGGLLSKYRGDHYGKIIWSQYADYIAKGYQYYFSDGIKDDNNVYLKVNHVSSDRIKLFGELQYRNVNYNISGTDNDLVILDSDKAYNFINPKVGMNFQLTPNQTFSAFYGIGNREPDRNDFTSANTETSPLHETLGDLELGYSYASKNTLGITFYRMDYKNQLVLTGALNDVGANLRTNVPKSYRMGIELEWGVPFYSSFVWSGNIGLSKNKINDFAEIIYDYTNGYEVIENIYKDTDIAFSPNVLINNTLNWQATNALNIAWFTKYVGQQYLDNTSNNTRAIDSYIVNDLKISYTIKPQIIKNLSFYLSINNIFNHQYESNGYTYSYIYQDLITENFLYPQAGRNIMGAINLKF